MLKLSMTLPVRVQDGGLFISRSVRRHPARWLESQETVFIERGRLTIQEKERIFSVDAGESLLLRLSRQHIGVGDFLVNLKFYWLYFEVEAPDSSPRWLIHLSVPQQTEVVDPQALVALSRWFLSEQEKHQRIPALGSIVLLILQQLTRDARLDEQADGVGTTLTWRTQKLIRTQYHCPFFTALLARKLYCNVDYLGRAYRWVLHLALTEAIHRQRVRKAEKLLTSEARSLAETTTLYRFNDVGYFRQILRKHADLTPVTWKRRYNKEHINSQCRDDGAPA